MSTVNVFFAEGYEEVEALTVVDILRRAGIGTYMVSVTGDRYVKSSHGVVVMTDKLFEELDDSADMLVLPGGMPGTVNLKAHKGLMEMLKRYDADSKKYLAAICAAPTVYGELGLLDQRAATCYPGMEDGLHCGTALTDKVVVDGHYITSRGMGTAIHFGLALVGILAGEETAYKLAHSIVYDTYI